MSQGINYRLHIIIKSPSDFLEKAGRYLLTTDVPRERIQLVCRTKQALDLLTRMTEDTYYEAVPKCICEDPERLHIGNTAYLSEECLGIVSNNGATGPDRVIGLDAILQNAFFYLKAYGNTCFAIYDTDDSTKLRPRILHKAELADTTLCGSTVSYDDALHGKHIINGSLMSE